MKRTYCLRFSLLSIVLLSCTSCQYSCHYEIRGIATNALDGRPIAAVTAELHSDFRRAPATATDKGGRFTIEMAVPPGEIETTSDWAITLSAKGYRSVEVAIGELKKPASRKDTVYVYVVAQLQPAQRGEEKRDR